MAFCQETVKDMASDEPGAAGEDNFHQTTFLK
jgi:hypothetical protein